jgi:uncharacterized FlaG/YvyC family protein
MSRGGAWDQLKHAFPRLKVREIDADVHPSRSIELGVKTYPTINVIDADSNRVVAKVPPTESARTLPKLTEFVRKHRLTQS